MIGFCEPEPLDRFCDLIDLLVRVRAWIYGPQLGGETNAKIVDVLNNAYDLARNKTVFKNLSLQDARQAVQSKQVNTLLVVIPLTEKYLALVKGFFPQGTKATPVPDPDRLSSRNRRRQSRL